MIQLCSRTVILEQSFAYRYVETGLCILNWVLQRESTIKIIFFFFFFFLSFCTEDFTAISLPCRYGVCASFCPTQLQKTPKQFVKKKVKMTQNCFKLICRSSSTELLNRDGLPLLYFSTELPEPFAWGKIPHPSIIVSRTCKLRFTSVFLGPGSD